MGRIFEATDLDFGREVALKVMLTRHHDSPDAQRRFFQEAQTTAKLQHPGIVSIYDMGVSPDGHPFFSMKLVEGSTLAHLLKTKNRSQLERSRLLNAFSRVCQTMAYAHSRHIVHLDLKPPNIMMGAFGEVYVMDWGLSRSLDKESKSVTHVTRPLNIGPVDFPSSDDSERKKTDSSRTHFSCARINGTPSYMAPEQTSGRNIGVRSDVFGLGAILCEILTGKPPYEGKSTQKVFRRAARGALQRTFQRIESCDADPVLIALTKRCLSPSPKDRPADAGAVATDMTAFVESSMERAEKDLCRFLKSAGICFASPAWMGISNALIRTSLGFLATPTGSSFQSHSLTLFIPKTSPTRSVPLRRWRQETRSPSFKIDTGMLAGFTDGSNGPRNRFPKTTLSSPSRE